MLGFGRRSYARRARVQNAPRFVPTDLSGCVLWLRADRGIVLATGVSQWNDQSGNGNNFAQATGANQPGYAPRGNAMGNGPALTFNGTSQFLSRVTAVLGNTNFSLFFTNKTTTTSSVQAACSWGVAAVAATGWEVGPDGDGAGNRAVTTEGVSNMADSASTTVWEEWTAMRDTLTWTLSVNGVAHVLTSNTSTPGAQGAASMIGAAALSAPLRFYNGSIDEVIGYSRKVTAAEQAQVEAYIRTRTAIW